VSIDTSFTSGDATRRFVFLLVRQRLVDAYRGTRLGAVWALAPQIAQIAVLALILGAVMRQKLGGAGATAVPYVVFMLPGVLAWQLFHDTCIQTADYLNAQKLIIKKNRVHLLWLGAYVPIAQLLLHAVFLLGLWLILKWLYPALGLSALVVSLAMAIVLVAYAFLVGLAAALLSVAVPDVRQLLAPLLQVGFWLTPIVYPPQIVPAELLPWLNALHPWYGLFVPVQQAWTGGALLPGAATPVGWIMPSLVALLAAVIIHRIYRYGRRHLLDAL